MGLKSGVAYWIIAKEDTRYKQPSIRVLVDKEFWTNDSLCLPAGGKFNHDITHMSKFWDFLLTTPVNISPVFLNYDDHNIVFATRDFYNDTKRPKDDLRGIPQDNDVY